MTLEDNGLDRRASALRRTFDQGFARERSTLSASSEDVLAIRVDGEPYAIRVAEIAGLYRDRRVVRVASQETLLLGISAFRGEIAPVFDLAGVLGRRVGGEQRWMVLVRAPTLIGFAFEQFEAHLRVPKESLVSSRDAPAPGASAKTTSTRGANEIYPLVIDDGAGGVSRPLIQLSMAVTSLSARARQQS